jgi:AcrR family transcriptional regulator
MTRDREATRARILAAAEQVLTRQGVGAVRINAVAAAAGVDKVLIYRYFGGRAQLMRALARERRLWPDADAVRATTGDAGDDAPSLAQDLTAMLLDSARELRSSPLARRAAAWSITESDEFAREIAAARGEHASAIAGALRDRHRLPPFVDLDAIVALLSAAMTHLAMHAAPAASFAGLELRRDEDWRRAERALANIVHTLLGPVDQ